MAFNPTQFKQKKKRVMNPDIPRPNLFSHEKKLKEQTEAFDRLLRIVERQQSELESLRSKYENMQASIDRILSFLSARGNK